MKIALIIFIGLALFLGESEATMQTEQTPEWIQEVIKSGASSKVVVKIDQKAIAEDIAWVIEHYDNLNPQYRQMILIIAHHGYLRDLQSERFFIKERYRDFLSRLGNQESRLLRIGDMRYMESAIRAIANHRINRDLVAYMDLASEMLSLSESDINKYMFFIDLDEDKEQKIALENRFTVAAKRWEEMWHLAWQIATSQDPFTFLLPSDKQAKVIRDCINRFDNKDQKVVNDAIKELRRIGMRAAPFLRITAAEHPSPQTRKIALMMIKQPPFEEALVASTFVEKYRLDRDILFLAYLGAKDDPIAQQARTILKSICPEVVPGETWAAKTYEQWYSKHSMYIEWDARKKVWHVNKQAMEYKIPVAILPYVPWPKQIAADDKKKMTYISSRTVREKARMLEYASLLYHEGDICDDLQELMGIKAPLSFSTLIRLWMIIPRDKRAHMRILSSEAKEAIQKDARSWLGKQQMNAEESALYTEAIAYGVDYLAWRLIEQSQRNAWMDIPATEREKLIQEAEEKLLDQEKSKPEVKPEAKPEDESKGAETPDE